MKRFSEFNEEAGMGVPVIGNGGTPNGVLGVGDSTIPAKTSKTPLKRKELDPDEDKDGE